MQTPSELLSLSLGEWVRPGSSLVSAELIPHLITSVFTFPLPVICKSDLSLSPLPFYVLLL